MTMAQGGLFNGDEEASGLFAPDLSGQSQTKKAKYHRAYRSNPQNKDRINSQKKRRRQLKKESQFGNVSSMFESAALPSKAEQQTIEKTLSRSDSPSLPNPGAVASDESNGSSQSHCLEQPMSVDTSKESINQVNENHNIQNQAELLLEIRDCLVDLRESIKPTAPAPKILEQQASVSEIANANGDNLAKDTAGNQAKVCSNDAVDDNVTVGKSDFLTGIFQKLSQLDGGAFITNFPAALALGYCAYLACCFVVEQTLPLYQSLKFPNPELASYGAIGLAIGFSALSVISKSSSAKLFAALIIAYEVLIVWAGSQANQRDLASEALRANPIHFSASEAYDIAKVDYEQRKARYEDKNSDVYHNNWYKIKHLDPAKKSLDEAGAKLAAVESELGERYQTNWMHLVLKALYRLSAVALVMLLAKETMKRGVGALSFWNTTPRKHAFPD
ncbi:MAG: hypothetical protein HRU09_01070 [Oligoflexales bacterium]|nr:hypothetical protein [Oligoflexales bacterium]